MKVVTILLMVIVGTWGDEARYDNYRVYRLIPKTDAQVTALKAIEDQNSGFDFWKGVTGIDVPVDIMVPPHKQSEFVGIVQQLKISAQLYMDDVQKFIDSSKKQERTTAVFDWSNYRTIEEIHGWLDSLPNKYKQVRVLNIGRSYEGRHIKGVKLSYKTGNKAVFLESGINGREWIAPATATYILHKLLTSTDSSVRYVAENYDWYIFPCVNPDGYKYSHTSNRLWCKTRQPYGSCRGVDPNRNWGYHWNEGGSSSNPCDDNYCGNRPFSEPEVKCLSSFITSIKSSLVCYIAFHSYSQCLLVPYGYTKQRLDNYYELLDIGNKCIASLAKKYGTKYRVGNAAELSSCSSGGSMDWVKGTCKTPLTYTYQLRDGGKYGYLLPPNQIIPSGEETLDSLVTMMKEAKSRGY